MSESWYSIVEYARAFSLSDMTVRRRIKNGRLEAKLQEGKYFIRMTQPRPEESLSGSDFAEKHVNVEQKSENRDHPPYQDQKLAVSSKESISNHSATFFDACNTQEKKGDVHGAVSSKPIDELVAICRDSMGRFDEYKRGLKENYEAKIISLEAGLECKNLEILRLKQELEDLQLLVSMFEKSNSE